VRQYISLFKLDYDLFFSFYLYLLTDYHNEICCDFFFEDEPIEDSYDDEVINEFYQEQTYELPLSNSKDDRILVDGYDIKVGFRSFIDRVYHWTLKDETCLLNVHSGLRNCRGDLERYKIVCDPWQDRNICYNSMSSLLLYNNCIFQQLEINLNVLVYDYKKDDFVINIEDKKGVCSVFPVSFKRNKIINHKIKVNNFKEKNVIVVSTTSFLGSYQISYSFSLFYFNSMVKMKHHIVDHHIVKGFFKYDHFEEDMPYDYKILYYDVLGDNGIQFCRPLHSVRSIREQKRYFLSLYWYVCKDFFKGECYCCFDSEIRMILLTCGHSVCCRCIYRITCDHIKDYIKCPFCRRSYYFPNKSSIIHVGDSQMYRCGVCLQGYTCTSNQLLEFPYFFLDMYHFIDSEYIIRSGQSDFWICFRCRVAKDEICDKCGAFKIYIFESLERLGFNGCNRIQCYSCHTNGRVRDVVEKEDLGSSY